MFTRQKLLIVLITLFHITACYNTDRTNPDDSQAGNHREQPTKTITATDGAYIDKIEVSWDSLDKPVTYHVYRADTEHGPYTLVSSISETTYTDENIETQKKYFYWIKVADETAQYTPDSGYSGPLAIPIGLKASENQVDEITITWEPATNATSYYVYRSTTESGEYQPIKATTETSYTDNTVEAGKLYFYRIKAYAANVKLYSDFSERAYGFSRNLYATDSITVSTRLINKIVVYWTSVSEASEYYIYRAEGASDYLPIAKTTAHSYEDTNVAPEKNYYYKIKSYSVTLDTYSPLSAGGAGFACLPLSVPEGINATQGTYSNKITIAWSAATGASSYQVYRSTDKNSDYQLIGNSTTTSYDDFATVPGTFYYYKIISQSACLIAASDYSIYAKGIAIPSYPSPAGIVLQKIPAGSFYRGQEGISGAEPVHLVTLTSSFYLGKYEITWSQWRQVRDWAYSHGYTFSEPVSPGVGLAGSDGNGTDNHPVTSISWYDAVKWCNALSEYEGKAPAYYTDYTKSVVYRSGEIALDNSCVNWSANGYRLPTEAEWEWAARAGTTTAYFWGENYSFASIDLYAWYYDNSDGLAHLTGQKLPNNFGLYDMTGNVREWCWDKYADYEANNQTDPQGPSSGSTRVMRGAGFNHHTGSLSVAARESFSPGYKYNSFGLRIVARAE